MSSPRPSAIYAIADRTALGARDLPAAVAAMAEAGVRWVQVRAKGATGAELYALLAESCRRLEGSDCSLWLDDRADLAALFPVAGVHLGQRDLPASVARRVVGAQVAIGSSTHNEAELRAAAADPEVDVVAVGPVFATSGKERPDPVVGLEFVRRARALTDKTLVAIGGIDAGNVAQVLAAGADSAAVLGAICRGDVARQCRHLLAAAEEAA